MQYVSKIPLKFKFGEQFYFSFGGSSFFLGRHMIKKSCFFFFPGLFEYSNMNYEVDRANDSAGEPSIAEMTEKAIKILQKNPKGYFLFVEGT